MKGDGTIGDVLRMKEDQRRRKLRIVEWLGATNCDFCRCDVRTKEYFFDAKTNFGPWALMCPECFALHGYGRIGLGWGQKYDGKSLEKVGG